MDMIHPLRHIGPKVFLSYSYTDRALAEQVERYLLARGFQVRKEDETSLLGQHLNIALPKRIHDAEVFVQLLTPQSFNSDWVKKEFEWADAHNKERGWPVLVPLVVGDVQPRRAVSDLVYVSAPQGLTDEALGILERGCMEAVEPLPLDENVPFIFDPSRVSALLRVGAANRKRVIVDSHGLLNTVYDQITASKEWAVQEGRTWDRISAALACADIVLPKLIAELDEQLRYYGRDYPARAVEPVNRFSRLVLGSELVKAWQKFRRLEVLKPFEGQFLAAQHVVEEGQRADPGYMGLGLRHWSLGTRPSDGTSEREDVQLEAKAGKTDVEILYPLAGLHSEWKLERQLNGKDPGLLDPYDWADFALPQIAEKAVVAAVKSPDAPAEVLEHYAWKVSDYRRVTL